MCPLTPALPGAVTICLYKCLPNGAAKNFCQGAGLKATGMKCVALPDYCFLAQLFA
jgi:hypothetical protein